MKGPTVKGQEERVLDLLRLTTASAKTLYDLENIDKLIKYTVFCKTLQMSSWNYF